MGMGFLKFLEALRTPFFDSLFSIITLLGDETAFLVIAIVVFWCINKREGYYVLITGFVGTVINQSLKLICKVPRPWKDPSFTAVESAIPAATGYSFPSGHTQNVTGTFGSIARWSRKPTVRIVMIAIILLVAFSRMYLGVHTPLDVGFSLVFGTVLLLCLYPIFKNEENFERCMPYVSIVSFLLSLGNLIYAFALSEKSVDAENLLSGRENAVTLFTLGICLVVVYFVDKKYVKFETGGKWYAQIIKLVLGLAILLLIKEGGKIPLAAIFDNIYLARGIRYFIVVIFAGCVWPLTFKFFSRLRIPALDNIFKKKTK